MRVSFTQNMAASHTSLNKKISNDCVDFSWTIKHFLNTVHLHQIWKQRSKNKRHNYIKSFFCFTTKLSHSFLSCYQTRISFFQNIAASHTSFTKQLSNDLADFAWTLFFSNFKCTKPSHLKTTLKNQNQIYQIIINLSPQYNGHTTFLSCYDSMKCVYHSWFGRLCVNCHFFFKF